MTRAPETTENTETPETLEGAASPETEARIRASFARQSMMRTLGAELDHVGDGVVRVVSPILEGVRQQQGTAHAGLAFSIADTAAGYAALTRIEAGMEVVTAEMKINLIAPIVGTRLIAIGRVVKAGRRLAVVTAQVWAEDDAGGRRLVALMQGTMVPVPGETG